MKHLFSKTSIYGAGWKPKNPSPSPPPPPPPAKLEPPKLGDYQIFSSHSNAEMIDLLSDGPIHGLVNAFGRDLEEQDILQGIYFDDTPIAISTQDDKNSSEIFKENLDVSNEVKDFGETLTRDTSADRNTGFFSKLFSPFTSKNFSRTTYYGSYSAIGLLANSNKGAVFIATTQFGVQPANQNLPSVKFNYIVEYESPNFHMAGWGNTRNNPGTILYKGNQQVHWWNETVLSEYSTIQIAKNNFQKLQSAKNINKYENQIIQKKLDIIDKILSTQGKYYTTIVDGSGHNALYTAKTHHILYVISVTPTFDKKSYKTIGLNSGVNSACVDENNKLKDFVFYFNNISDKNLPIVPYDCIVPEINNNNEYTGRVYGFYAFYIKVDNKKETVSFDDKAHIPLHVYKAKVHQTLINAFRDPGALSFCLNITGGNLSGLDKYNYSNVACEIKKGMHNQRPLSLFNKVYIDSEYNSKLLGPFRQYGQIRRFKEKTRMLLAPNKVLTSAQLTIGVSRLYFDHSELSTNIEGSLDNERQGPGSFHHGKTMFDEEVIAATHVIENPEVDSVIVSLRINELKDTLTKQMDIDGSAGAKDYSDGAINNYNNYASPEKRANIGSDLPTVVTIRIETGKIKNETFYNKKSYDYTIYGYIPSPVVIDFGNPNNQRLNDYDFITKSKNREINDPYVLPELLTSENPSEVKRYVRVYKVSTETNSVLIRKEVFLAKITEIIDTRFSYPYCALVGNKIDARSISSIPMRSYDCRLKRIKVPSNYTIIKNGYDVRYQNSKKEYESRSDKELIYDGDWNGEFSMGWTDNPAWILYDMLTNKRYGLGQYLEESQINVWELYKIGRYCDAVDDNGFFIGVSNERGGLEPRFSCNIMFSQATKIFDAINIVANLFRGSVFFSNSEINFVDDRPREPIALFTNSNVKDAAFNYISNKKDDIFNVVEVAYLDKNDNFKTKIEYIEDSEDIRNRGPQKTVINTVGVTSKSMARRIGQHAIWQTTKENQGIEFVAGLESLLCKPGDLIIVEDDLKNRKINCGRILDIDINNRQLRLDNPYDENNFNGYIEVYTPTGEKTKEELTKLASLGRERFNSFEVKQTFKSKDYESLTGQYIFSKYIGTKGFYTGQNKNTKTFCYYDEDLDGWVFSTGLAFQKNNIYDKVISNATTSNINQVTGLFRYNVNEQRPKGKELIVGTALSNKFLFSDEGNSFGGILDDEINTQGVRQISKYQISSVVTNILDGSIVTLNEDNFNLNLLKFVQPGSPYRCQLKDTENQIYKVISVREENQNEYTVVGTKYDTGKWSYIENDTFIENPQQVFYSKTFNQVLESLPAPHSLYLDSYNERSSNFSITGSFKVSRGNLFKIKLENKAVNFSFELDTDQKSFNITGLNDLGKYELTVQNISSNGKNLNSYPSQTQKFIGYQKTDVSDYDRPFIQNFTII